MFKALISKLYHRYVCKPEVDFHQTLEEFLKIKEEEYWIRKFYDIDTFEKIKTIERFAEVTHRIKNDL